MFPVVDISHAVEHKGDLSNDSEKICTIANEILDGLQHHGFIYIKGHGFDQSFIDETFKLYREHFFNLSVEQKSKLYVNTDEAKDVIGYIPINSEVLVAGQPGDLKEGLEYKPHMAHKLKDYLHKDVFKRLDEMFARCFDLTLTLLRILSISLKTNDFDFFAQQHKHIGKVGNLTILRSNYYPRAKDCGKVNPLRQWCTKHTDFGTITLLFQDDTGGLEVLLLVTIHANEINY